VNTPIHLHPVDLVPQWVRQEGDRRKILVDNPCRLYDLASAT
jgi:predicted TIM-barrel fold metal-dependent hydrolase